MMLGWALTFPNGTYSEFCLMNTLAYHCFDFLVGWIATIRLLGDTFEIEGFFVWHTIMAVLMCIVWLVLFTLTVIAFWKGKIFLAKDEDVLQDMGVEKNRVSESETSTLADSTEKPPHNAHGYNYV